MADIGPAEQARVKRAMEMQSYRLSKLPGYEEWSRKYQDEYPDFIEDLDHQEIMLHPDEVAGPHEELFEDLLEDMKSEFNGHEDEVSTGDPAPPPTPPAPAGARAPTPAVQRPRPWWRFW